MQKDEQQRVFDGERVTVELELPPDFFVSKKAEPIDATMCELVKDPARFLNVEVNLRSEISSYGIDTSPALFDGACSSKQLGFGPANKAVAHDQSYRKLEANMAQYSPMKVTFVGRLDYALAAGHEPVYGFRVEEVVDLIAGRPTLVFRESGK
jgi:hypothetical protein